MKITNKNIKVGYEKDLFNTKWSSCINIIQLKDLLFTKKH